MSVETSSAKPKWYRLRRLGLTGEYISGIIAGCGLGVMTLAYVMSVNLIPPYWNTIMLFGMVLIPIGVSIECHIQRQRAIHQNNENK